MNVIDPAIVFPNQSPKQVAVMLRSEVAPKTGTWSGTLRLRLDTAGGRGAWKIEPASAAFQLMTAGEEQQFSFTVTPPVDAKPARFTAVANLGGKELESGVQVIAYSHIPPADGVPAVGWKAGARATHRAGQARRIYCRGRR